MLKDKDIESREVITIIASFKTYLLDMFENPIIKKLAKEVWEG